MEITNFEHINDNNLLFKENHIDITYVPLMLYYREKKITTNTNVPDRVQRQL